MLFKKLIVPISLFLCVQCSAQRIIINGEETSRLLKWEDFSGSPDRGSPYFAFTYWNVSTRFDAFRFSGDTAKWQPIVTVELGNNSWRKKDKVTDSLLKHEQGHFDIGILCAMELQQRLNNTIFLKPDYQAKLNQIVHDVIEKYKKMDVRYDEETSHFSNREQQHKWDAFFDSKIVRGK